MDRGAVSFVWKRTISTQAAHDDQAAERPAVRCARTEHSGSPPGRSSRGLDRSIPISELHCVTDSIETTACVGVRMSLLRLGLGDWPRRVTAHPIGPLERAPYQVVIRRFAGNQLAVNGLEFATVEDEIDSATDRDAEDCCPMRSDLLCT